MIYIDGVKQNEKDLLKKFGLVFKGRATFILTDSQMPDDRANGGKKVPRGKQLQPSFTFFDEASGQDKEFRYSEGLKKVTNGKAEKDIEYNTRRIEILRGSRTTTKADLFLFMMLYPQCANSPFNRKGIEKIYELKDTAKKAAAIERETEMFAEFVTRITKLTESDLIVRASGLPKDFKVGVNSTMDPAEIRVKLYEAARKLGVVKLDQAMNSALYDVKGTIKTAMSRGIIQMQTVDGRNCYVLMREGLDDAVIMVINLNDKSPELSLEQKVAQDTDVYTNLKEAVSDSFLKDKLREKQFTEGTEKRSKNVLPQAGFEDKKEEDLGGDESGKVDPPTPPAKGKK